MRVDCIHENSFMHVAEFDLALSPYIERTALRERSGNIVRIGDGNP